MPIRISDLIVGKRNLAVPFGDSELNLVYNPNNITVEQEALEQELRGKGQHIRAVAATLANLVSEWDLVDEDGEPMPPTAETFEHLGWPVMVHINKKIVDDYFPNALNELS